MDNKRKKYLIALSGLFHDIGKFYQRATNTRTSSEDKSKFGRAHAVLSYKALKEDLYNGLKSVFKEEEIEIIVEGTYHHKPSNEIQYLLQKADWVSSSERDDIKTEYYTEFLKEVDKEKFIKFAEKNPRLRSIFENLNIGKDYKRKNYFYKISPLSLDSNIFPKDLEKAYTDIFYEAQKKEDILGSYQAHWELFKNEFNKKLKSLNLRFNESPEKVFSTIYHILYKYLWCIPSSTYDQENYSRHYPDISLFDHSRVLSAVACCFYDFNSSVFTQKNPSEFKEELKLTKVFLHIKGDISGIQKFIYNVYSGKGGVAKILRGRSFYVALLPEVLSRYILNELGYPISNLLYSGGGIFEILLANTEENLNKLEEIQKGINEFLSSEFEADLGLSLGYYQYSPIQMMENYKDVLRNLNESLDNAKKEKFEKLIESGEIFELLNERSKSIEGNKKKCPVCQTYLIDENLEGEKEICNVCETFREIGHCLPQTETIIFAKSRTQNFVDSERVIDFKEFGIVYLLGKDNYFDLQPIFYDKETTEILDINNTSFENKYITGFKFMGKTVPEAIKPISPEESGEDETIEKNQIAPFTYLAKYSDGDKRIGIIRMDVDNLGRLFNDGLRDRTSISRIATLSRLLDLFFAGYLNKICEDLSKEYKKDCPEAKIENFFYILYSGGDDVFLVAPWDKAIDVAKKIQTDFEKYTCYNPNVTISAGYLQTKPKFPIRVGADLAGETEEIAKSSGKNRICVLGDVLEWEEIQILKQEVEKWVEDIAKDKLQRGFIYAVHRLKQQFLKDNNKKDKLIFPYKEEENPMFYPYAQYYIARNINDDNLRKEMANFLLKKENLKKLTFVINYTALKTRK
ncbi:CRISPR-associated protein Cas10/Csm1, subtype III-A/MTUBE [Persephonella hydrogeniphila]|uniref:CRISPR system single-strand-specific deoxyribonuclease Cas10/Csm1 (subtype III-A) n=1 Tax=Persephonella hydrogeniphila TaxID=198703 RepID=A0A285NI03_9AQUI|nr:type III-A CRISPR-associated protein Cas10/Csm1 [Persephonella hydrogeniphila]SNZ09075.1 CRISPR-associated protein Cas10/Csm1, subtype III-A/MTUBE [Persephonella hydrogeniphila]